MRVEGSVGADSPLPALRARVESEVVDTLTRSALHGFLGSMPVEEQIDHALGFVAAAEAALGRAPTTAADLGTGGGVPGLILHSCWPTCRLVLVDGNERRTDFLVAEVAGWTDGSEIMVVRGRAEEIGRDRTYRGTFELVTARSFGRPSVTVECGAPLLSSGGVMVVSEPPGDDTERRWPEGGLEELGLSPLGRTRFDDRFGYQVLIKSEETPERYPRRVGVPAKRPLF